MIGIIVGVILIVCFLDGLATFIPTVCRNNKVIEDDESLTNKVEREWFKKNSKEIEQRSEDGLKLKGYEFKQSVENHTWIILVHGYRIDALTAISPKFFYDKGWNVLCPDLRGHGKSEGKYIGMGWQDRKDLMIWINQIIKQDEKAKIVLYGGSMGGAAVMMLAGECLPEQVVCGIEDSGFTTAWDMFAYTIKNGLHIPVFPTLHLANILCKIFVGYSFKEASAINQLKKSTLPMLFIHGMQDQMVPFNMMEKVYNAAKGEKEKLIVEEAGHVMSYRVQPKLYWQTVYAFIEKYIKESVNDKYI